MSKEKTEHEIMVLSHDPQPGYRGVFYIVCLVAVLYLGAIFVNSLM